MAAARIVSSLLSRSLSLSAPSAGFFLSTGRNSSLARSALGFSTAAVAEEPITPPVQIEHTQLLINGQFVDSASGKTFPTYDPRTGEVIAQVAEGHAEDINRAVSAARKAFDEGPWPKMTAYERSRILIRFADLVEKHSDEIAALETWNNGKPYEQAATAELPMLVRLFHYYAGWADKIHGLTCPADGPYHVQTLHEPIGVAGQIIPWNFPLLMFAWKVGPALACGNTIVLKTAEQTPLTALYVAKLFHEAGLPPGVLNIVSGFGPTAGAALASHMDVDKCKQAVVPPNMPNVTSNSLPNHGVINFLYEEEEISNPEALIGPPETVVICIAGDPCRSTIAMADLVPNSSPRRATRTPRPIGTIHPLGAIYCPEMPRSNSQLAFTGSTDTGKIVLELAAKSNLKPVTLELGGKSPFIICEDADIDNAVELAHFALFFNQGQCCCAGSRTFVHERIYDEFLEKAKARAMKRVVGDPFKKGVEQGPQIDSEQFEKVLRYIRSGIESNATLECGGGRLGSKGFYIQPTVFSNVQDDMLIAQDEIFGPVQSILKFNDIGDVIKRANTTRYGLAAGVFTSNVDTANTISRALKAGTVWVNCFDVFDAAIPFGGYKMSGIGREKGIYSLNNYLQVKAVVTPLKNPAWL
ncbi:unnamed protein product [Camellia sinensis]